MKNKMERSRSRFLVGSSVVFISVFAVAACGGTKTEARSSGYNQNLSAEFQAERQEFISETQQRLSEVDNRISELQSTIQGESPYVSESQRAEWREDLAELKREQQSAQSRLQQARTASPQGWREMRSDIGLQVDRLEAGVEQIGYAVSDLFAEEQERVPARGEEEQEQQRQPMRGTEDEQLPPMQDEPIMPSTPVPDEPMVPPTPDTEPMPERSFPNQY